MGKPAGWGTVEEIEAWSQTLFDTDGDVPLLHRSAAEEMDHLYRQRWPGIRERAMERVRHWGRREAAGMLHPGGGVATLEELAASFRVGALRVAADFTAALAILELDAHRLGTSDEVIRRVRATPGGYAGYLGERSRDLGLSGASADQALGEEFSLARPLAEECPALLEWTAGALNTAFAVRKSDMEAVLDRVSREWAVPWLIWTVGDIAENVAWFAGFFAYEAGLWCCYESWG